MVLVLSNWIVVLKIRCNFNKSLLKFFYQEAFLTFSFILGEFQFFNSRNVRRRKKRISCLMIIE